MNMQTPDHAVDDFSRRLAAALAKAIRARQCAARQRLGVATPDGEVRATKQRRRMKRARSAVCAV